MQAAHRAAQALPGASGAATSSSSTPTTARCSRSCASYEDETRPRGREPVALRPVRRARPARASRACRRSSSSAAPRSRAIGELPVPPHARRRTASTGSRSSRRTDASVDTAKKPAVAAPARRTGTSCSGAATPRARAALRALHAGAALVRRARPPQSARRHDRRRPRARRRRRALVLGFAYPDGDARNPGAAADLRDGDRRARRRDMPDTSSLRPCPCNGEGVIYDAAGTRVRRVAPSTRSSARCASGGTRHRHRMRTALSGPSRRPGPPAPAMSR